MTRTDAKQIATELDRRQRRRRLIWFGLWVAAIVAAVLYLRCGRGWGIGGNGPGGGGSSATAAPPSHCSIRVSAAGIAVDGKPATREAALAACRDKSGADVIVTGDARQGDWDDLRAAFEAAKIPLFVRSR